MHLLSLSTINEWSVHSIDSVRCRTLWKPSAFKSSRVVPVDKSLFLMGADLSCWQRERKTKSMEHIDDEAHLLSHHYADRALWSGFSSEISDCEERASSSPCVAPTSSTTQQRIQCKPDRSGLPVFTSSLPVSYVLLLVFRVLVWWRELETNWNHKNPPFSKKLLFESATRRRLREDRAAEIKTSDKADLAKKKKEKTCLISPWCVSIYT